MRQGVRRSLIFFAVLLAACPVRTGAAPPYGEFTGVRGRTAWNDNTVAGAIVYAYRDFDDGFPGNPVAASSPTPADGSFSLELPPGDYFLAAVLKSGDARSGLQAGDRFCYFGGNPVHVNPGKEVVVGLNLSSVSDDPVPDPSSRISGVVYDERGKPLPGATVYLYKSPDGGFKGMPGLFARTGGDGTFRARVRKGKFFVIVRKRKSGDLFGPTLPGDFFGYYARNPVVIEEGKARAIRIDALPRQVIESKFGEGYRRPAEVVLRVKAVDPEGRPVPGVRVLAYRSAAMTGFPAFVSGKTRESGETDLTVTEDGRFHLLARERLGGPADGEWYGRYSGTKDHSMLLSFDSVPPPVTIVLEKR